MAATGLYGALKCCSSVPSPSLVCPGIVVPSRAGSRIVESPASAQAARLFQCSVWALWRFQGVPAGSLLVQRAYRLRVVEQAKGLLTWQIWAGRVPANWARTRSKENVAA
jgi:hypothetical protein